MSTTLDARIASGRRQHGDRFDPSGLLSAHPSILDAFASGLRVKVTRVYASGETFTRTGVVSTTTGWRPAFLLMHRSNATGSSDVLDAEDYVTGTKRGRAYDESTPYGYVYPAPVRAESTPVLTEGATSLVHVT